ncbi:MAG: hypothetical protein R3F36_15205 [Candidatus Competibacteraceae bacterium]
MGVNDRLRNGKSHAHAAAGAGIERLENVRDSIRRNAMTLIRHADLYFPIINRVHVNRHLFVVSFARANTPHRVLQKVDQDKLKLQRVGKNLGKVASGLAGDTAPRCSVSGSIIRPPLHQRQKETQAASAHRSCRPATER